MRCLITIFFVFALLIQCNGQRDPEQKATVDSLKTELSKYSQNDTAYINILSQIGQKTPIYRITYWDTIVKLSEKLISGTPTKAEQYALNKSLAGALNNIGFIKYNQGEVPEAMDILHKSLEIKEEIGNKEGAAYSLNNLGYLYNYQGDISKALQCYERSLKYLEDTDNKMGTATCLNNMGAIYKDQGDVPRAISNYNKSLKIYEKIESKSDIAIMLNNIGIIYLEQEEHSNALENFEKSLKFHQELSDKKNVAVCLNNIGDVKRALKQYSEAREYLEESLEIREQIADKEGISMSLNNIGRILDEQGDLNGALDYYQRSLRIEEEIENISGICSSLGNVGGTELQLGKLNMAKIHLERGLKLAQDIGAVRMTIPIAKHLSVLYKKQNNHSVALKMYELYVAMKDSLASEENQKAVIRQEYKYQYEKQAAADSIHNAEAQKVKDAEILAQKTKRAAENRERELEKKRDAQQSYFLVGILTLSVFFGLFIFNRFRLTKKQRDIIDVQKQEVEAQKEKVDEAFEQLEEKNTEILDSINYAKRIQSAILPPDRSCFIRGCRLYRTWCARGYGKCGL